MKNILLSALTLLFFQSTASAQSFAPVGAEWVFTTEYCFFQPPSCGYYTVTVVSDTIFDNQTYSVLEKKYLDPTYSYLDSTAYVTSVGDSVFTYDPYTATTHLLYDFSRVAGDTIVINDPASGNTYSPYKGETVSYFRVVVDSVNTIVAGGMQLRVQYTTPTDTSELTFLSRTIERIGNTHTLFGTSSSIPLAGYFGGLVCYSESGFHFGQPIETCGLITSLEQHRQIEKVRAYPNPATENITIETDKWQNMQIELYDATGRAVLQQSIGSSKENMGVGHLPRGVYVAVVYEKGVVVERRKLVLR